MEFDDHNMTSELIPMLSEDILGLFLVLQASSGYHGTHQCPAVVPDIGCHTASGWACSCSGPASFAAAQYKIYYKADDFDSNWSESGLRKAFRA